MRVLLDTCVLSEIRKQNGHPGVKEAVGKLKSSDLFISVITIGEIAKGIALLRESKRESALTGWLEGLEKNYASSILLIDVRTVHFWSQFDLREIATMLDTLGLQFEGFELAHPLIKQQFLAARLGEETDLAAWARFEERNPQTFDGMYVMWCRKARLTNKGKSDE